MLSGQILWVLLLIGSDSKMSSNSRITCSAGLSDGMSLPPYTRPRKDADTKADNTGSMSAPVQQQAEGLAKQHSLSLPVCRARFAGRCQCSTRHTDGGALGIHQSIPPGKRGKPHGKKSKSFK